MKEIVQFVSARPYLNVSMEEFNKLFLCYHGRREVVVLCSSEIKKSLDGLEYETNFPKVKEVKKYLDSIGVEYTENFKNTTTI